MVSDFHSHVLPGIDDGSDSVQTSIRMLELAAGQGVRFMAATPHFYASRDRVERFLAARDRAEGRLRDAMEGREDLPRIITGAEVAYFPGMSEADALGALTLGGSGYLLVEMPFATWTERMLRELEKLHDRQGLTPVIAHLERYLGPLKNRHVPDALEQLPVLVQANAEAFLQPSTARRMLRLLEKGRIHLLGSDCHNLTTRRPNLGEAAARIRERLGKAALERIREHEDMVLAGISES